MVPMPTVTAVPTLIAVPVVTVVGRMVLAHLVTVVCRVVLVSAAAYVLPVGVGLTLIDGSLAGFARAIFVPVVIPSTRVWVLMMIVSVVVHRVTSWAE